ncbi:hypothetical protein AB0X74_05140 [Kurthia gibsonii]|uniref:phage tail protein n=1 Tax=Kurthia gibsonii TaxID=33946 RepID=UPI003F244463
MAGNIKGITIELNGDSTKLTSAIDGVKRQSIGLQSELKEIDKLLKFSPGNADLIAQKQQNLGRQITATAQKLDVLKQAQQQVEAQFRAGTLSEEKYNAFQREVINTEMALKNYKVQLETVNTSQQELQSKTKQLETLFQATGTSVDQYANAIGVNLLQAIKSGTASSAQLDQAIAKIGKAALGSEIDVEKMKQALATVDDGASLDSIRQDLSRVAQEANQAETEVNSFGDTIKDVVAGLATGGGIAAVVSQALDVSSLNTKIDITFDVPEESKASVRDAIKGVETYGIDAEAALQGVQRQWALNKEASDETNSAIIDQAGAIANVYAGIDFNELIQESYEMGKSMGISQEEALGLTKALLKTGFPAEQLDIISEYGTQLKNAGYNAEEIQAIMSAGVDTGTWNIDNLLDGLKEGRIKMAEFGQEVPKATKELLSGTDISAKQLQKWGQDVAKGGKTGSKAMTEVAKALVGVEDETQRNALGVALFGTMYEDQGKNITDTLINASKETVNLKDNQEDLNSSVEKLKAGPAVQMKQAMVDIQTAIAPLLASIAEVVGSIAKWVSQNSTLAGVIAAVVAGVGLVVGIFMALAPIVMTISTIIGGVGAAFGAMILPVLAIVAAVAAFVALGIAVYKNWDGISEFFVNLWEGIKTIFTTSITAIGEFLSTVWDGMVTIIKTVWDGIKLYFTTVLNIYKLIFTTIWTGIKAAVTVVWNAIKTTATTVFNGIKLYFTTVLNIYKTIFTTVWNAIKTVVTTVWNGIKSTATTVFNAIKTTITTIFNAIKTVSSSVWNSIKAVISTVVNGIRSVITTVFNAVRSVVTTIWNGIKSTSSSVWNSIKSVVSSAVNGIRSVVTTVFNAVRSVVSSVMSTVKSVISSAWNGAKSIVSSAVNSIKSTVSTVFNALKGVVSNAMSGVKSAIESGWNKAKGFLEGINLFSIGKNIIEGLIKGIKNMAGAVGGAIKSVADGAVNSAKKALGIHSPSRVMRDQVGYWVSEGLAKGITANTNAEKAAKQKAQAIKNQFVKDLKNVQMKFNAEKIDTKEYIKQLGDLKNQYKNYSDGIKKIDVEISKASKKQTTNIKSEYTSRLKDLKNNYNADLISNKEYIQALQKMKSKYAKDVKGAESELNAKIKELRDSASADNLKRYEKQIADETKYNNASLEKQVAFWKKRLNKFKKNSEEYLAVQEKIKDLTFQQEGERLKKYEETYNDKVKYDNKSLKWEISYWEKRLDTFKKGSDEYLSIQAKLKDLNYQSQQEQLKATETYQENVAKLDAEYLSKYQELTEKYTKAVDDRTTAITNFAGIFDEVKLSEDVSGEQLLANLQQQNNVLVDWMANLGTLANRGLDEGLLAELQQMGPKSAAEIAALTTLSDEQLQQYTALWKNKSSLARQQAIGELEGMRLDTANQIYLLQEETKKKLEKYQSEWKTSMKAVTKSTKDQFKDMPSIGSYAVQGLIDGMNSRKAELEALAAELAAIVSGTVASSLDIHSPSRVMKKLGGYTTEGFIIGMQQAAKKLANASSNVFSSLSKNAAVTSGQASNISTSKSIDNSKSQNNHINVYTQESPEKAIERTLNRMAFKFA